MWAISSFMAPSVYILARKIFEEFEELFKQVAYKSGKKQQSHADLPESKELSFLFSDDSKFNLYRKRVYERVTDKKEKILTAGVASIFLPLYFFQDYQRDF